MSTLVVQVDEQTDRLLLALAAGYEISATEAAARLLRAGVRMFPGMLHASGQEVLDRWDDLAAVGCEPLAEFPSRRSGS